MIFSMTINIKYIQILYEEFYYLFKITALLFSKDSY
jgi:hypothetical protein